MRPIVALILFAATSALAQDKPAVKPEESAQRDAQSAQRDAQSAQRDAQSASGGATAPTPSFRRDATASQALFDRLDKNRDGYLTGTELTSQEALSANWIGVDRDTDGRISRSEFSAITGGDSATARRE